MNRIKFAIFALCVSVMFASNSFGQLDGNPENFCRNGFFPREDVEFRIANVVGNTGEKIHFYSDEREDCPAGKNCRRKSYLVPGDEVIVSRSLGGFSCVWYQPRVGSETVSWIPTPNLKIKALPAVASPSAFLGEWSFYENSITVKESKKSGVLAVYGNAFWKGLGDNIHIGEIEEEVSPKNGVLLIGEKDNGEYDCKATMKLIGRYLIVGDNLNCGGANVTFTGVYRRSAK